MHGARPAGTRDTLRECKACKRPVRSSGTRPTRSFRVAGKWNPARRLQPGGNRHPLERQRCLRARCVVPLGRREAQGTRPRACEDTRASTSSLPQLSERRERSERSEFCGRPGARASQGSLREAQTAPVARRSGLAGAFARRAGARRRADPHAPLPNAQEQNSRRHHRRFCQAKGIKRSPPQSPRSRSCRQRWPGQLARSRGAGCGRRESRRPTPRSSP